jgi:hypothetical protein
MRRVRLTWKAALAAPVTAVVTSACSSPTPTNTVSYQSFRFTCCASSVVLQAWHPGHDVALHWIGESAGVTSDDAKHPITLAAVLTGPYASVALLKAGGAHADTIFASPMHVTDRTPGNPVSSIGLPIDLPAGWYNLATTIRSAGGSVSSGSVIKVTQNP